MGLLEQASQSMILEAAEKVLYVAELPIKFLVENKPLIKELKIDKPIEGPVGLLIKVNTKSEANYLNVLIHEVLAQLHSQEAISDLKMIRQLHAARLSSFQETIEIYVFALEDVSNASH